VGLIKHKAHKNLEQWKPISVWRGKFFTWSCRITCLLNFGLWDIPDIHFIKMRSDRYSQF